jgi:hypothetical protein
MADNGYASLLTTTNHLPPSRWHRGGTAALTLTTGLLLVALGPVTNGSAAAALSAPPRPQPIAEVKRLGGAATAAAIADGHAYLAVAGTVEVWQLSSSGGPRRVGQADIRAFPSSLTVSAGLAYTTQDPDRLAIHDVTDPTRPRLRATLDLADEVYQIAVVDHYAYVANNCLGLVLVDAADPDRPAVIDSWPSDDYCVVGVAAVRPGLILMSLRYRDIQHWGGIVAMDTSDPLQPRWLGYLRMPPPFGALSADGGIVAMVDGEYLRLASVSDPTKMQQVWVGKYPSRAVVAMQSTIYLGASDGLHVLDASRPEASHEVAFYPGFVAGVAADSLHVATAGLGGARLYELAGPTQLTQRIDTTSFGAPINTDVDDGIAVAFEKDGTVSVVDVSPPISATVLSRFQYAPEPTFFSPLAAFVNQGFAMMVYRGGLWDGRLAVVDIRNPRQPGAVTMPLEHLGRIPRFAVREGDRLFMAKSCVEYPRSEPGANLSVYDVSAPEALRNIGGADLGEGQICERGLTLAVADRLIWAASDVSGLFVKETSDTSAIKQLARRFEGQSVSALAATGRRALVSVAGQPRLLELAADGIIMEFAAPDDACVDYARFNGDRLFTACVGVGVHVYDVSTPDDWRPIGRFDGPAGELQLVGDDLFVSAGQFGLHILHVGATYRLFLPTVRSKP